MTIRQSRIYLLVADERKQLTAARQPPVVYSVIFGSVKPSDIRKSLGPAHGECGRTRVLIPDQTGCPIYHNFVASIESCRLIIPHTVRFRVLAAAGTGHELPGRVIAFRLICF
jgi:hypothetical protein